MKANNVVDSEKKKIFAKMFNSIDLVLRAIAVAMGIATVTLMSLGTISIEDAVVLLGIGVIAMALERMS